MKSFQQCSGYSECHNSVPIGSAVTGGYGAPPLRRLYEFRNVGPVTVPAVCGPRMEHIFDNCYNSQEVSASL